MTDAPSNCLLDLIREEFPDYHPLLSLARIAHKSAETVDENDEIPSLKLQVECHTTIAKYTESQRKSIEVKGAVSHEFGKLRVFISNPDDFDSEE